MPKNAAARIDPAISAVRHVITMTSTQIKKGEEWLMQQKLPKLNSNSRPYTPPMLARQWAV